MFHTEVNMISVLHIHTQAHCLHWPCETNDPTVYHVTIIIIIPGHDKRIVVKSGTEK